MGLVGYKLLGVQFARPIVSGKIPNEIVYLSFVVVFRVEGLQVVAQRAISHRADIHQVVIAIILLIDMQCVNDLTALRG
ncbi:hypothetical protein KPSA3_06230 [Pseudomonas syringae pv. actinidiae]|uniref:Uncharacterized protein n=1 Tax=Pseudomonas syringae pv. actinidiae TaxID=103796 RepID=A0AAN4TNW0_PSESF|nr:hypothetical protein KPSA3_06230 [Pseudomonas syringae pv. actinidiae]